MPNLHRHNPVLRRRLEQLVENGTADQLRQMLDAMSNSERRTAGYLLGEELLAKLSDTARFVDLFYGVVPTSPKAYLGTFLKGAVALYQLQKISFAALHLERFGASCSSVDAKKVAEAFLPLLREPDEVRLLTESFFPNAAERSMPFLIAADRSVCYWELLRQLRCSDADASAVRNIYLQLMRRATHRSYNMAYLLSKYFGLEGLPGHFQLTLAPYELSRLETSYELFEKTLNK